MKSPAVVVETAEQKVLNDAANDPTNADPPLINLDDEASPVKAKPTSKENMATRKSPRKHTQKDQKQDGRKSKQSSLFDMMMKAGAKRKTPSDTPPKAGEKSEASTPKKDAEKEDKTEEQAPKRPKKDTEVQVVDVELKDREEVKESETSVVEEDADKTLDQSAISVANSDDVEMKSDSEDDKGDVSEVLDTSELPSQDVEDVDEKKSASKPSSASKSASKPRKSRKTDPAAEKAKEEKLLERELKQKQKEEEKRQKEEDRKKREEERKQKEEERKRLKEEKERKRKEEEEERERRKIQKERERLEREAKQKAREEEIKRQQEEKRKLEEAKQKEEEAKTQKQQKQAQAFAKFFKKAESPSVTKEKRAPSAEDKNSGKTSSFFKPFSVKENMRLAPVTRAQIDEQRKARFDEWFAKQGMKKDELYLKELKKGERQPGKSEATFPPVRSDGLDSDVEIIEVDEDDKIIIGTKIGVAPSSSSQEAVRCRAKLLYFHANRRPAYWGTWRKKSKNISGRRPFATDNTFFDYDVDSDDEWEDEDDNAESLKGNSDDDRESEDDYEIDNEFFVPHGYLSDGEGDSDDEAGVEQEGSEEPEAKEKKLKLKMAEFVEDLKRKTARLQPIMIGPLWHGSDADNSASIKQQPNYSRWVAHLEPMEALLCFGNPGFVYTSFHPPPVEAKTPRAREDGGQDEDGGEVESGKKKKGKAKTIFPEEAVGMLVKLVHGNSKKRTDMAPEFNDSWVRELALKELSIKSIPKICILAKIKEIASYNHARQMWLVKEPVLVNFPDVKLPDPATGPSVGTTPGGVSPTEPSTLTGKKRARSNKSEVINKDAEEDGTPTKGKTPKRGPMDMFLGKTKKKDSMNAENEGKSEECDDDCVMLE